MLMTLKESLILLLSAYFPIFHNLNMSFLQENLTS